MFIFYGLDSGGFDECVETNHLQYRLYDESQSSGGESEATMAALRESYTDAWLFRPAVVFYCCKQGHSYGKFAKYNMHLVYIYLASYLRVHVRGAVEIGVRDYTSGREAAIEAQPQLPDRDQPRGMPERGSTKLQQAHHRCRDGFQATSGLWCTARKEISLRALRI